MPTYEYICTKCGNEFEKVQPMAAAALTTCPQDICGQKKWGRGPVKRKMSGGAGLIFKGTGFYITDYRSEGYKQAAQKDTEAAKPAASPDTKPAAPAKPAPKTDSKPAKHAPKKH